MAITQIIATLPAVLNDSETFYEDIAVRNNSLVTVSFPSINTWATQANALAAEVNDKAAQVAAQAVDGGYSQDYINDNFFSQDYINDNFFSQDYINSNFIGVNNAQNITAVKTFTSSPIVPTPTLGGDAVNKDYVDNLRTIATGTTTFTATTNNINLTGIGIGLEIGDVIQISGANDAKNNSEFTVEVITDANNIIVNQAHANKGTTKNVANRSGDTGVTVKLLSKWYNAPVGLGQDWVDVTASRTADTTYLNSTKRIIQGSAAIISTSLSVRPQILINTGGIFFGLYFTTTTVGQSINFQITSGSTYQAILMGIDKWSELR